MQVSYIRELKNHNTNCFEEIYFNYNKPLYNYFYRKIHAEAICEDLIQDTFIKLWRYRTTLNEDISFDVQLFRIAKTTLIDVLRRKSQNPEISVANEEMPDIMKEDAAVFSIDFEKRNNLLSLFEDLSPAKRRILHLKLEGYSNKEIAQELGVTVKTIENNVNLAYKELRKLSKLTPLLLILMFCR